MTERMSSGFVLFVLAVICISRPLRAADPAVTITGRVIDRAPNENFEVVGIDAVKVHVEADGRTIRAKGNTTDADGNFTVEDVPLGKVTITCDRLGYLDRPTIIQHDLDKGAEVTIKMMNGTLTARYIKRYAQGLAKAAGQSGPDAYKQEWTDLYKVGLPVKSRVALAKAIVETDPKAAEAEL